MELCNKNLRSDAIYKACKYIQLNLIKLGNDPATYKNNENSVQVEQNIKKYIEHDIYFSRRFIIIQQIYNRFERIALIIESVFNKKQYMFKG